MILSGLSCVKISIFKLQPLLFILTKALSMANIKILY